ncbi:hypothetical protein CGCSCA1_v009467 [Colletotrichum siamense]|nr:hypothetical protein CGCSCA1_v009467 [Colletotrichum siamense]
MASWSEDGPNLEPQIAPLPSDSTAPSTADSSFVSENQVLMDSESKNTTPSASPQKAGNMVDPIEFGAENDATHMPEVSEDLPQHENSIPGDDDSDNEEINDSASVTESANLRMRRRLRFAGKNWRRRDIFLPPPPAGRRGPPLHYDQLNVKNLHDHLNMMKWVSQLFEEAPSSAPSDYSEDLGRVACVAELKGLNFREWDAVPLVPPGAIPYTYSEDKQFAICYLAEDNPLTEASSQHLSHRGIQAPSSATTTQSPRPQGVESLPPSIRVHSLAVRRFLAMITDGKLRADVRNVYMIIYRPYKLLVHFEDAIREHLALLADLCTKSQQVMENTGPSDENDQKGGLDNDPVIKDDVEAQGNLGNDSNQDNGVKNTDNDADGLDNEHEEPSPPNPEKSSLNEALLFTKGNWDQHSPGELQEAYDDFSVFVSFVDKFISPLRKALKEVDDMSVNFNELWHLYSPGSIVYVKDPSVPQKLWRVIQGSGGAWLPFQPEASTSLVDTFRLGGMTRGTRLSPLTLDCYYVDFDGTRFVRVVRKFHIDVFKDLASIKSLSILPLRVAEREGLVDTESIHLRASDFLFYTQYRYCYYRGRSLTQEPEGAVLKRPAERTTESVSVLSESIESPVVVDFKRCFESIPGWKPCRTPRELTVPFKEERVPNIGTDDDRLWDLRMAEKVLNYTDQSQALEWNSRTPPKEDELLLLPGRVFAYVLRTRKWACLSLGQGDPTLEMNCLEKMKPELTAWENLQIDHNHRAIIQSMMATHFRKKKSERRQFDLIQDKGKGLIVLLHGVPGVGKTSTAETVAQYYNKPLLPITCGDLGMTPTEVETNLQNSFQLAQVWDCVLLLDEADVFLAERSQDNIERNALVSVFLRVMEYYEGILFLTTNKVGSFDEAFKSRMSLALYYPPLTQDQTEKIWDVQIRRTEQLSVDAAPDDPKQHVKFNRLEIMSLAKELWMMQQSRADWKPVWNGRQIRNAFQTAVALAEWHQLHKESADPINVKREHFEKVAFVSNEFNAYLYTVKHGRTDENLSLRNQHRADQFDRSSQIPWGGLGFAPQQQYPQFQQQQQGLGGWGNLQNSNVIGSGGQGGMTMGVQGLGNNNFPAQTGFGNPLQSGFGAMGNQVTAGAGMASGGLNNTGVGNSGMNNYTMGGQGVGNPAMGNQGMGNQAMANQNVGSGMQTGSINPQGMSGQNIPRQMMGQQQ